MSDSPNFPKDPNAVLDYKIDWTTWLAGDTISSSTWIVPSGITKTTESNTTTTTTIWLSGGTADTEYEVVNRIVTAGGRTDDRTLHIFVADR
jgi:hypothetical protein